MRNLVCPSSVSAPDFPSPSVNASALANALTIYDRFELGRAHLNPGELRPGREPGSLDSAAGSACAVRASNDFRHADRSRIRTAAFLHGSNHAAVE